MIERNESHQLLVDLLHEAAQLEHSILDAYLYTACSLKSMPQEFAAVVDKENRRRAVQYERVRAWKQSILMITHEKMLHLHYVQCLIRALGEPPSFTLPERDADSGNWIIPNWQARIGEQLVNEGRGVEVPGAPLSPELIRHFVLFKASDSLQDQDPFGDNAMDLFNRLYAFELDFRFESMLLHVEDDARRKELKQKLHLLYTTLTPLPPEVGPEVAPAPREVKLPPIEELKSQSISDFYWQGILPLYEQAYDFGWVKETNRKLNNELLDPAYAAQGFLPVGPIKRDKNFEATAQAHREDPLSDFMRVEDIVKEIVEEGEGIANFEDQAEAFLSKVEEPGGTRAYLQTLLKDRDPRNQDPTPPWLREGEFLRQSHLYRFAMIMVELNREIELAQEAGVDFEPARQPESSDVQGHAGLKKLAEELPAQFNACYLVLIAWLARIYEIRAWMADKPRRLAIEMLASWPL